MIKDPVMKNILIVCILAMPFFLSCGGASKDTTTPNTPPGNLTITAVVASDSSGNVSFTTAASNAVTYDFNFGNGVIQTVPSGSILFKYTSSGTYTVNVIATSASGQTISANKQITVGVKLNLVSVSYTHLTLPTNREV